MARPSRRGPSRRGGSYSSQRQTGQRATNQRSAPNNRRQNGRRGGYGGGRGSGGNDQMPIYIGLGVGAVVLIGVLIFLLAGGGGDVDVTPVVRNNPTEERPVRPADFDPDAPEVLLPFSSAEKERIRAKIEKLDEDYDEAKDLKDEGFLAQNRQDYEDAQAAWKEAQRLLNKMDDGSNTLELEFGAEVWERIEQFMPTVNRTIQRWGKLRREFTKYLK